MVSTEKYHPLQEMHAGLVWLGENVSTRNVYLCS